MEVNLTLKSETVKVIDYLRDHFNTIAEEFSARPAWLESVLQLSTTRYHNLYPPERNHSQPYEPLLLVGDDLEHFLEDESGEYIIRSDCCIL